MPPPVVAPCAHPRARPLLAASLPRARFAAPLLRARLAAPLLRVSARPPPFCARGSSPLSCAMVAARYLEELAPGDALLIVDGATGAARACVVGRCKIEPRPLLRVHFEEEPSAARTTAGTGADADAGDASEPRCRAGQIFLQQAETVRLVSPGGEGDDSVVMGEGGASAPVAVVSATELVPGKSVVLASFTDAGTHVGRKISARVSER